MRFPSLSTARLVIRPFAPDDWQDVFAYAADPAVMAYIPGGPLSAGQAQEFVATHGGEQAQAGAVLLASTGQLIGQIIFHAWFAPRTYEIGWVFHPAHHGRGYATEAARAMLNYGFEALGLHRVIATCQPENTASYRVMEKLGMRREGWFRKCIHRGDDDWWDELFYALLEEERR